MTKPQNKFPKVEQLPSNTSIEPTGNGYFRILVDGHSISATIYYTEERAVKVALNYTELRIAQEIVSSVDHLPGQYSREQYETACRLVGIEPDDESQDGFDTYGDKYGNFWIDHYEPEYVMKMDLRLMRRHGINDEKVKEYERRLQQLSDEGLKVDSYDRDQYERACTIMGITPTDDSDIEKVAFNTVGMVHKLADRRNKDIPDSEKPEKDTCDNCGVVIWSGGMLASLGIACDPECYDALS